MVKFGELNLKERLKKINFVKNKNYCSIDDLKPDYYVFCKSVKPETDMDKLLDLYVKKWETLTDPQKQIITQSDMYYTSLLNLCNSQSGVYYLNDQLYESLKNTKLPNVPLTIRPFIKSCFLFLPKSKKINVVYLYTEERDSGLFYKILAWLNKKVCVTYNGFVCYEDPDWPEEDIKEEDSKQVLRLVFNLLLYKSQEKQKETVTVYPTKPMGFGKNTKQLIEPIVLGAEYKPKTITVGSAGGTHASPRTHWRMGHWRNQCCGSRDNPEHRPIWIEPVLVNP
jgi:hypothetical protein